MSEKVAKLSGDIAKAIYEKRNGVGAKPWHSLPKSHQEPYRQDAQAAIDAILGHFTALRGDPRLYGQGFHDPYGPVLSGLRTALSQEGGE